jgi:hypothetical protein
VGVVKLNSDGVIRIAGVARDGDGFRSVKFTEASMIL